MLFIRQVEERVLLLPSTRAKCVEFQSVLCQSDAQRYKVTQWQLFSIKLLRHTVRIYYISLF